MTHDPKHVPAELRLIARIWVVEDNCRVLVGQRFEDGEDIAHMIWHTSPETIRCVLWIEEVQSQEELG
ncbi:MAG: hypothetical protein DI533_17230 [Cereibacter sphaeroides]|uniref:Uncharacterized protein n=1 Tax=Cereibacter sphaeroides TaxID=1063 RepID=A0A2W5RZT2_CERSP|nr:MAG: hypothetical protein DI533_17230 [Cereibacter sphaeroides]